MKADGQLTTAVVALANRHKGQYRCRLDLTSIVALAKTHKRATEVPVRFNISCCTGEKKLGNTGDLPVRFNISCCTGEKKQWEIQVTCRLDLTSAAALAKRSKRKYR